MLRRIVILAATAGLAVLGLLAAYAVGIYPVMAAFGGDWRTLVETRWFALGGLGLLVLTALVTGGGLSLAMRTARRTGD